MSEDPLRTSCTFCFTRGKWSRSKISIPDFTNRSLLDLDVTGYGIGVRCKGSAVCPEKACREFNRSRPKDWRFVPVSETVTSSFWTTQRTRRGRGWWNGGSGVTVSSVGLWGCSKPNSVEGPTEVPSGLLDVWVRGVLVTVLVSGGTIRRVGFDRWRYRGNRRRYQGRRSVLLPLRERGASRLLWGRRYWRTESYRNRSTGRHDKVFSPSETVPTRRAETVGGSSYWVGDGFGHETVEFVCGRTSVTEVPSLTVSLHPSSTEVQRDGLTTPQWNMERTSTVTRFLFKYPNRWDCDFHCFFIYVGRWTLVSQIIDNESIVPKE